MDLPSWQNDLNTDLFVINELLAEMCKITPEDDFKLQHLKNHIHEKLAAPINPENKKILVFTAFADTAKTPELDEAVLRCIDQAIPFPIFYQLNYAERLQMKAVDSECVPLPLALDLGALYELMLRPLLPMPPRAGESIKMQLERLTQIRSKQNEYRKIAARLHKERHKTVKWN